MESVGQQIKVLLATYGMSVLGAIVILILGWIAARLGRRITKNLLGNSKVDPTIISFVSSLVYFLVLTFVVLAALAKFGIQTAFFVAILGAAGFAVGFALQGALANFAAGILILLLRPFKVGDYIIGAGEAGTVKDGATINDILNMMKFPEGPKVVSLVNNMLTKEWDKPLKDGDKVLFTPLAGGGSDI